MRNKFISNLSLLLFLNLLVKPFWIFGIEVNVQNIVGDPSYGEYFSLLNTSIILNIFLDLGITNYNNRDIAQNQHLLLKYMSSLISIKLLLGVIYSISVLIMGSLLGYDLNLLMFLALNQFLVSFILYLRSNITGLLMFTTDSIISVLDRILLIGICSFLIWGRASNTPIKIEWFVYAQTTAYAISCITCFIIVARKAKFRRLRWNFPMIVVLLRRNMPYALLVLFMSAYYRIDGVMIEQLLDDGKNSAGLYAKAYRILDASVNFSYLFATLLLPIFSYLIKKKESILEIVRSSFSILFVTGITLTFGVVIFSEEIMRLLYDYTTPDTSMTFCILMFCFFAISMTYIFGTLLTANGNLKALNIISITGLIMNIVLNFLLIPTYEIVGAAVASLITQTFILIVQVAIVVTIFKFNVRFKDVLATVSYTFGMLVLLYGINKFELSMFNGFIVLSICSVVLAILFGLLKPKTLYEALVSVKLKNTIE